MDKNSGKKAHAVCVPFPAQGHIIPMMQLAKLMHSRGFYITFVNTEFNHRRLVRSRGPDWAKGFPDFQFKTIPEGLPPSDRDATQDPAALSSSIRENCLAPFQDLLVKLHSAMDAPPVTCVISDGIMSFAMKAVEEFGIPVIQFWTASACGFTAYLQFHELIKKGVVPFKDESYMNDGSLDVTIDWIPGMRSIRLKDMPSFVRTTNPNDILLNYMGDEAQNCLKSSAIILNTFDTLEHEVLQAISSISPQIYTLGPLSLLANGVKESELSSFRPSLWKEDTKCLKWLDQREPNSVVYVNYGSVTRISEDHLKEFAWGLANSKHPFLWIVRPDLIMGGGDSVTLPKEFLEETKDRGLLTSWCLQDQVLSHSSVSVFLTHCGWNSMLESMCCGVPVICWPFFAEQQTNCRYACTKWGIGVEVGSDVKRREIEGLVREMMEGDGGKEMKKRAVEWKKGAEAAADVGGSSYSNFDSFINETLRTVPKFKKKQMRFKHF